MTTGRINQVNGGTSGNEPSIFWSLTSRTDDGPREPSPLRARQVRMKELPLHSHRGLRGSASHPRPTDEVRLEPKSHHAVRGREVSEKPPSSPSGEAQGAAAVKQPPAVWSLTYTTGTRQRVPPRCRGMRRCWASLAERKERQSRVTRSVTSVKTSERAVTHKKPSLNEHRRKVRGAADAPRRQPRRY